MTFSCKCFWNIREGKALTATADPRYVRIYKLRSVVFAITCKISRVPQNSFEQLRLLQTTTDYRESWSLHSAKF